MSGEEAQKTAIKVHSTPVSKNIAPLSKGDFRSFFARKYGRLLKAALTPSERRPDYKDPAVIDAIRASYADWAHPALPDNSLIPKRIFMLWQQGWDSAPPLVRACRDSWARHNPDWELVLVDDNNINRLAPDFDTSVAPKAGRPARSNLARLALLQRHGGVWADATLFCTRPLDRWLPAAAPKGLFLFSKPRPYRYVDIWFIAAAPAHPAIGAWQAIAHQYWQHFTRPHHYYWMEYLFEMLCARDPETAAAWQAVPPVSALGPLAVGGNPFDKQAPREVFELIEENIVPAHKLSHKWRYAAPLSGTPVGALTGLTRL